MSKAVLFQTIQFSTSTLFSSIRLIDRNLSDATTSGQSGTGSDGNKGAFCILQSSRITGASPSDFLVSYLGHSLREFYPFAEMQSVQSTAPDRLFHCITTLQCGKMFLEAIEGLFTNKNFLSISFNHTT